MTSNSAWLDLINSDGSDEFLYLCSAAMVEIQEAQTERLGRKLEAVLAIVGGYVVESNDSGGIDCNDLVTRLAFAGFSPIWPEGTE